MNTDRLTVQLVVIFIGLASLLIISGLIVLAYCGRDVPEPLSTLGGAAIGALGTLLARTSTAERRSEAIGDDANGDDANGSQSNSDQSNQDHLNSGDTSFNDSSDSAVEQDTNTGNESQQEKS